MATDHNRIDETSVLPVTAVHSVGLGLSTRVCQTAFVGLYNRLHIDVQCVQCEEIVQRVLQFKHGACWLHDYALGDSVQWVKPGVNYGEPIKGKAWVPAYAEEACTACGADSAWAEFAVMLVDDELVDFEQAPRNHHFREFPDVHPLKGCERPVSVPTNNPSEGHS